MPLAPVPLELLTAFRNQRVHLFLGSGVSSAAGLMGWNSLIAEMCRLIREENHTYGKKDLEAFLAKEDYLDIADVFRKIMMENGYFTFLRQQFRRGDIALSTLHRKIAQLPVRTIFTTNYDKLLETAFRSESGIDPAVVIYPEQLGYIEDRECKIIKIHGDIDHPTTLVLTRSDYAIYEQRHREFVRLLHGSFNDYIVLFIGFGLRDTNFRRIYQDARSIFGTMQHSSYAIMTDSNAVERELWEKQKMRIIPVSNYQQVSSYISLILRELAK